MVIRRPLAIVCLSIACGKGSDFSFYDAGGAAASSSGAWQPPKPPNTCDAMQFTVDGLFSGFTPSDDPRVNSTATFEWSGIVPLRGKYTYMYIASCSTGSSNRIYFINDWYLNDKGAIAKKCFNRFDFFDPASATAVELRVYGDHHVEVFENGAPVNHPAKGAAGFAASPNVRTPHSLFEFQLDLTWSKDFQTTIDLYESDPCAPEPPAPPPPDQPSVGAECDDPSYLVDEPTRLSLTVGSGGVTTKIADDVPGVSGLDKYDASPGDRVVLRGRRFGSVGHLFVGGIEAQVLLWTDSRVQFVVPAGVSSNAKTTITGEGFSVDGPRITGPSSSSAN